MNSSALSDPALRFLEAEPAYLICLLCLSADLALPSLGSSGLKHLKCARGFHSLKICGGLVIRPLFGCMSYERLLV